MRSTVRTLLLCAVSYVIEKCHCLNFIDVPLTFQLKSKVVKSNHVMKKVPLSRFKDSSIYIPDSPEEMPEDYSLKTRRIQTMPRRETYSNIVRSAKRFSKYPVKGNFQYRNTYDHKPNPMWKVTRMPYPPIRTTPMFDIRRYFLVGDDGNLKSPNVRAGEYEDEKDTNLKNKISTLVQQTIHDTERKITSIQYIKESNREEAPYKAGFILSMIKKSRDVLNELFNVAVKHKDEWKALEQMKIFELIVHTNVDTTNLVRQLVEIHIQHLNATRPDNHSPDAKRRVVLLR